MRTYLFFTILFISATVATSQQLVMEAGRTTASFEFGDMAGNKLDNLQASTHTFIGLGYRQNFLAKNLNLNILGTYSGYGAIGSDRAVDNYFEWDLNYIGLDTGLDYEFLKAGDFIFFIKGSAAVEFLVQGTQTLNNQVFNLTGEGDFDTPIYFFRVGLGIQYRISEKLAVLTQYRYGKSGTFKDIPGKLNIKTHQVGIAVLISLAKDIASKDMEDGETRQLREELEQNSAKIRALETKTSQVDSLKQVLATKEEKLQSLKKAISRALVPYNGSDLSLQASDGKVYINLENDILFKSGKWQLIPEGKEAIDHLGAVLAKNPGLQIRIEGHTDDRTVSSTGAVANNLELSTKRAIAVAEILKENKDLNPKNLTVAGRGAQEPVANNDTEEGRAKNRRITIILMPRLDELIELTKN